MRCVRQESNAHWSIEVLLLKMSEVRRGVGGRPAALVEGGKSTQYYVCEACPAKVKAFHLKKHYKDKTNFALLANLGNPHIFWQTDFKAK